MTYTCPMHPEVVSFKKGTCPKCGMALTLKDTQSATSPTNSYMPLFIIIGLILLTSVAISWKDVILGSFSLGKSISYFMTGFFLVFAGFKLMDIKGFAQGYSTYDLLAKRWFTYGYIYPFIELFFGVSMVLIPEAKGLLLTEFIVMVFSGSGVLIKLLKHEKFQCACLGTFLKVPLTKVTLIEDFGMAVLALLMLFL